MKDLQNYTSAIRDVGLNSTPMRAENGFYRWSNGQLEILNIPEYNEIRNNKQRMDHLDSSLKHVASEILAFETPVNTLEQESEGANFEDSGEINEHKIQLHQFKSSLSQLDKDLLMRGYIPPGETRDEQPPPVKKRQVTAREIFSFLLIWFVGEVFMTYVQWNNLRDGKGMEDMIVRSISFGVVLFLIHLVGRYYEQHKRLIYQVFLIFSFTMLFTMLLAPLILNELYPYVSESADTAAQWSLSAESEKATSESKPANPFLVDFYRNNDMLPGIFVFLFFIIMQTFIKKKTENEIVPARAPASRIPESAQNEIEEKRQYFLEQIGLIEGRIAHLEKSHATSLEPNTHRLDVILSELQSKQTVLDKLKLEKTNLAVQNERLLKKLEMHLNRYHTEFQSVLQNDPVKSLVIKPEWPTTADLKAYFALN